MPAGDERRPRLLNQVGVLLQAAGEKAFCAGGDVANIANALKNDGQAAGVKVASDFFYNEYAVDYLI